MDVMPFIETSRHVIKIMLSLKKNGVKYLSKATAVAYSAEYIKYQIKNIVKGIVLDQEAWKTATNKRIKKPNISFLDSHVRAVTSAGSLYFFKPPTISA